MRRIEVHPARATEEILFPLPLTGINNRAVVSIWTFLQKPPVVLVEIDNETKSEYILYNQWGEELITKQLLSTCDSDAEFYSLPTDEKVGCLYLEYINSED